MAYEQLSKVIYDSKVLIPAPFISLSRTTHRTEDGHGVGHTLTATLTGKIVSCRGWDFTGARPELWTGSGYPTDDTDCCKFQNILDMQMVIRETFRIDNEYHWFEIQSLEGSPHPPKKWLARVADVNFKEGNWVQTDEYVITLELMQSAEEYGSETKAKEMANTQHTEKWDIQFDPDNGCAYNLTHSLSCQAKQWAPDDSGTVEDGWKLATKWVKDRLTQLGTEPVPKLDQEVIFDIGFLLTGYLPYNYQKSESADQLGGVFSATETWKLTKDPVLSTISVEYNRVRDGDFTVKVHGNFKSFLNAAGDNPDAAMTAFTTWDNANTAYALANAIYDGGRTLNSCPVNRTISQSHQKRGDDTEVYCSDQTRIVDFSFDFSDGGDHLCDTDITVTEKFSSVPITAVCYSRTISVEGNIQGHRCKDAPDAFLNATNCLALINALALANAVYSGGRTLSLLNTAISRNERKSNIHFSYEFTDEYTNGIKKSETITESWACERRGSSGEPTLSTQIDGTLEALCEVDFADVLAAVPTPASFNITCGHLLKQSINRDETHKRVSYNYSFDEECGTAIVLIDKTTKNGPDKCAITYISVQVQITGIGCTDDIASANAYDALTSLDTSGFAPLGYCRTAHSTMINNTGKVNANYDYSSAGDSETNITKTETYDSADCGIKKTQIQGHIKGCCGALGGAYAAAETAYSNINLTTLCDGYIVSHSKTTNENDATISFSLECQDRPENYVEEKTITTRCDIDQTYTTVVIDGSISPLCITDKAAQIAAGEAALVIILATLPGLATNACTTPGGGVCVTGTPVLKRSSVTKGLINGKISYQYEYACLACPRISGSIEESIEISTNRGGDSIAIVPILGRLCGPLIQNKNTKKETTFSVSITFRFKPNCCVLTKPAGIEAVVNGIISSVTVDCVGGCTRTNTYTQQDTEGWNPCTGRYTRNVSKIIECC